LASSVAAKESDHKHEGTNDDQNHRCVEVGVPQKVKVLGHVDLDKSTNANESHTCQNQDKVEKKNYILHENLATTHFGSFSNSQMKVKMRSIIDSRELQIYFPKIERSSQNFQWK